jgi:MFS family permease
VTLPGPPIEQTHQRHRGLAVALICLVTVVAFETMSVATVMPEVLDDIGGLALYGWVFSAFALGQIVGIVVSGVWADRSNPVAPVVAGLLVFLIGLVVSGTAATMAVVVVGRALQGFGSGVVPTVAYVCIGRGIPQADRARTFAWMSSAWLVPSLIGPLGAAWLVRHVGWEWVFLGLVPVTVVVGFAALAPIAALGPPDGGARSVGHDAQRMGLAVAVAMGAGLLLWSFQVTRLAPAAMAATLGGVVLVLSFRAVTPVGTLRARPGAPAAVAVRGLLTASFFGAEAFVTLALSRVRDTSTVFAGAVLAVASFTWTAGSWGQARWIDRWGPRRLVQAGLAAVAAGVGSFALVVAWLPLWLAFPTWGLAAAGIGLAYSPLSQSVLAAAQAGSEGEASSGLQLSDVLGFALGSGFAGVIVTAVDRSGGAISTAVAMVWALALIVALTGIAASRGVIAHLEPSLEPFSDVGPRAG